MGVRTTVIDGCCFFVEGLSSTFESPSFTGVDGFIDDFNFSTDDCNSCIDSYPCLDYEVGLAPCSDECGTEFTADIRFGCDSNPPFDSATLVGRVLLYTDGNCYYVTEVYGPSATGTTVFFYNSCVDCVEYNPCVTTPTPTPTRTLTPTPTPTRTLTPTPTPTAPCAGCSSYIITNNDANTQTIGYQNCLTGGFSSVVLAKNGTVTLCSCILPEVIPPDGEGADNVSIAFNGPCTEESE